MSDILYVAWQDPVSRRWHTIARLSRIGGRYELRFTKGSLRFRSLPEDLFHLEVSKRYVFDELIYLFKNRIPPRSRSDFFRIASWLDAHPLSDDFSLLSKFGLIPGTDGMLVYPAPSVDAGIYAVEFFIHGMSHMHKDVEHRCRISEPGTLLYPMLDVKNKYDEHAVAVRCDAEALILGYVPAFYAYDFHKILSRPDSLSSAQIVLVKANPTAPHQLRMLCRFSARVGDDFRVLDSEDHHIVEEDPDNSWEPRSMKRVG